MIEFDIAGKAVSVEQDISPGFDPCQLMMTNTNEVTITEYDQSVHFCINLSSFCTLKNSF